MPLGTKPLYKIHSHLSKEFSPSSCIGPPVGLCAWNCGSRTSPRSSIAFSPSQFIDKKLTYWSSSPVASGYCCCSCCCCCCGGSTCAKRPTALLVSLETLVDAAPVPVAVRFSSRLVSPSPRRRLAIDSSRYWRKRSRTVLLMRQNFCTSFRPSRHICARFSASLRPTPSAVLTLMAWTHRAANRLVMRCI